MNQMHQQQLMMQQKQQQMQKEMQQKQQQLKQQLQQKMQQEQQQLQQKQKQLQQQLQQQEKQIAAAKTAAQQALANEQSAAAQAAQQLTVAQAAMRARMGGLNSQIAAEQAALNGNGGVKIPNATKFSEASFPGSKGNVPQAENLSNLASRAGLTGGGGSSGFGRPSLSGRGGMSGMGQMEGMGGRPPQNPGMRGRGGMGMPGEGEGEGNAPGSRSPMGGRGDKKDGTGANGQQTQRVNVPESEEYLTDMPTAPELLAGRLGTTPPQNAFMPPRAGLPGKLEGVGGPGGPGRPQMPGAPRGNRSLTPEELAGRRKRIADAEEEDALLSPPMLLRPDLTGRNGMPDIDWAQIRSGELDADTEMLGVRAKPAPSAGEVSMPSRLASGRRKDTESERKVEETQERSVREALDELWTVQTPETIEAPNERKTEEQQQEQRGRALGTG
jgi:hypothetical protein